jgi:hypothetical protein
VPSRERGRGIDHPAAETGSAGRIDEPSQSPPDQNWHANRKLRTQAKLRSSSRSKRYAIAPGLALFGKPQAFWPSGLQPHRANQIVDNQSTYCRRL